MIKFIFSVAALLAIAYFGLGFFGYQVHPENFSYYIPQKPSGSGNALTEYLDTVKLQHKFHPLISKGKGASSASKLDQGSTNTLKQLMQVDKLETFEKLKKDIKEISDKADQRDQQLDGIMETKVEEPQS